jgi:hypothetical protein
VSEQSPAEFIARTELADAREEKRAASHVIALIQIGAQDGPPSVAGHVVRRREIELQVAELRLTLWSEECRRLESRLRGMGLRP